MNPLTRDDILGFRECLLKALRIMEDMAEIPHSVPAKRERRYDRAAEIAFRKATQPTLPTQWTAPVRRRGEPGGLYDGPHDKQETEPSST
jgi:hypothetical protein